jgi:hypothetical protein
VLLAVVVANGAALALVIGRGTDVMLGALGGLVQLPIVLALGAALHWVLTRLLHLPPERTGLVPTKRDVLDLGAGLASGVLGVAVIAMLALASAEVRTAAAPSPAALSALASFTVNAALQQLALVGLAFALGPRQGAPAPLGLGLSLAFFVLTHASESVAPVYLSNVALFGLATLGLFVARRGLGWAVGLHGGWNTALFLAGGVSLDGAGALQWLSWTPRDVLWSGGPAGFEHGLANTVVCAVLAGVAWGAARRQGM